MTDEIFGFTLMPGHETTIDITSRMPCADGTIRIERNTLTLASEAPVKIAISTGPLSEMAIGKGGKLEPLDDRRPAVGNRSN
jgi:hypothetical protein